MWTGSPALTMTVEQIRVKVSEPPDDLAYDRENDSEDSERERRLIHCYPITGGQAYQQTDYTEFKPVPEYANVTLPPVAGAVCTRQWFPEKQRAFCKEQPRGGEHEHSLGNPDEPVFPYTVQHLQPEEVDQVPRERRQEERRRDVEEASLKERVVVEALIPVLLCKDGLNEEQEAQARTRSVSTFPASPPTTIPAPTKLCRSFRL